MKSIVKIELLEERKEEGMEGWMERRKSRQSWHMTDEKKGEEHVRTTEGRERCVTHNTDGQNTDGQIERMSVGKREAEGGAVTARMNN